MPVYFSVGLEECDGLAQPSVLDPSLSLNPLDFWFGRLILDFLITEHNANSLHPKFPFYAGILAFSSFRNPRKVSKDLPTHISKF